MKQAEPHPSPELLLAVAEGVLPAELGESVQRHLEGCAVCRRLQQDLTVLGEPAAREREELRARVFAPERGRRQGWIGVAGAVAAAVVCVVAVRGLWPRVGPENAVVVLREPAAAVTEAVKPRLELEPAPLRLPLATALVLRGQPEASEAPYLRELGRALVPYRAGRWAEAAGALDGLGARYTAAVEPPFYAGVARLLAGDAAGALARLERSQAVGGEALEDDIAWYLAVAQERLQHWDRAAGLLRRLCEGEGPYRAAACRGLAK